MSRILLVEDDDLIGTMVRLVLEQDGHQVDWHTSAEDGADHLSTTRFDAILLDISLPGMSGLELARKIRRSGTGTPIVMLTAQDHTPSKVAAFEAGADDYVCKPFDMVELIARVRAQIRRSQGRLELPSDRLSTVGRAKLDMDARRLLDADGNEITLSDKELELVLLFARHPGRVLTRADILDEVWGMDAMPSERTVDNFIVRLRRWVEPSPETPRHIVTVRGRGYRYDP
ncbi:MAG: response regulator transcription factor [Myxococcales bacterium]|nr:response regulator transcription factor [Myxococcales bacterium]